MSDIINFKIKKRVPKTLHPNTQRQNALKKIIFKGGTTRKIKTHGLSIDTNKVIKNVITQKTDLRIFKNTKKSQGGNIIVYVDCSGSMRNYTECADFLYDLWAAVEQTIDIRVIAFSSARNYEISVLDFIDNKKDLGRVIDEDHDLHDDLGHALRATEKMVKRSGKTLCLVITDGLPEANREGGEEIPRYELVEGIQKQIIRMENSKTKFFAIMLNRYDNKYLNEVFRGKMYQTENLNEGINKLAEKINEFLKRL